MLKSIYTPLSGAVAQERVLEMLANNLANVNTAGYKGESVTFELLEPEPYKHYKNPLPPANYKIALDDILPLRGNDMEYVGVSRIFRDDTQGSVIMTSNPLDLMIEGEGYFAVQTKEGIRLTRNGSFSLNEDGALVDKSGHPVHGEKGTVYLRGTNFRVNHLGEVYLGEKMVDRLKIYRVEKKDSLEKVGSNNFYYGGPPEELKALEHPVVRQGQLEASNVNAIRNITDLILAHRTYEAYQKSIQNYDSMMDKSSNSIGVVRT